MAVVYAREQDLAVGEYIDLLRRSGLAERRPVEDVERIDGALRGSNLVLTARVDGVLVGAARAMTDVYLRCDLADPAVDAARRRRGDGLGVQRRLRELLAPGCKLKLSAAPEAANYYPRIGYIKNDRSWELPPDAPLG